MYRSRLHQFLIFFLKIFCYFCTIVFLSYLHNIVQQSNDCVSCSDWCAIFPHNISNEIRHVGFANTRKDVLLFDTFFGRKQKH